MAQTEGPFYTPDTPERRSLLEPGMPGTRLLVSGYVYSTACQPVPGALLDFWHCDDAGVYDNQGYRLRGHQFADDEGRFELETIVPGLYTGRTRRFTNRRRSCARFVPPLRLSSASRMARAPRANVVKPSN